MAEGGARSFVRWWSTRLLCFAFILWCFGFAWPYFFVVLVLWWLMGYWDFVLVLCWFSGLAWLMYAWWTFYLWFYFEFDFDLVQLVSFEDLASILVTWWWRCVLSWQKYGWHDNIVWFLFVIWWFSDEEVWVLVLALIARNGRFEGSFFIHFFVEHRLEQSNQQARSTYNILVQGIETYLLLYVILVLVLCSASFPLCFIFQLW